MTTHRLKTWPKPFALIIDGRKTAEIRRCDDREFYTGDRLELVEYDPNTGMPTGREVTVEVTCETRSSGPLGLIGIGSDGKHVPMVMLSFKVLL